MTEQSILDLIKGDPWMMNIITTASSLNLRDWMIGAGFVRNKVWNYLADIERRTVDTSDVDLIYFDPDGNNQISDEKLSIEMRNKTGIDWEIVNEFYTHTRDGLSPYVSTEDALSRWPETVTAIAVTLDAGEQLRLVAPYGIHDLVNFIVRKSPKFDGGNDRILERVSKKKWQEKWPMITLDI